MEGLFGGGARWIISTKKERCRAREEHRIMHEHLLQGRQAPKLGRQRSSHLIFTKAPE